MPRLRLRPRLTSSTWLAWARHAVGFLGFALAVLLAAPDTGQAQPASPNAPAPKSARVASEGTAWEALSASQKSALKPLEREWSSIEPSRKVKWLEVANKLPSMPPAEQARVQTRMEDWAKLTPRERGQARLNYKEAQQVPAQERKDKWEAYKALPPDQRKQLAARKQPLADPSLEPATGAKSNLVPNSSYAPRPKAIAPTVAQAKPGATTNLINKRPSPPVHQQAGLPKIVATPGFVDQATLLPKRGPQGAATRSAAASTPGVPRP